MKYIKIFEEFNKSFKDDVLDILSDIVDVGNLDVHIDDRGYISINCKSGEFTISDIIIESILRLLKYCSLSKLYLTRILVDIKGKEYTVYDINEDGMLVKSGVITEPIRGIRSKISRSSLE